MSVLNISNEKVNKLSELALKFNLVVSNLSNGISLKSKDITFTFYSGDKGTYCIDRFTGKIEKGTGFKNLVSKINQHFEPKENTEISVSEAIEMLKNDKYVFYMDNGMERPLDSDDCIYMIFDNQLYKKTFSVTINGEKINSKSEAIDFINSL